MVARIIFAVVGVLLLGFLGFWGFIIAIIALSSEFYAYLLPGVCLLLAVWLIVWATGKVKGKYMAIAFACIIGTSAVSMIVYHTYQTWLDDIPVMSNQENYLWSYRPFIDSVNVTRLDEPTTLQFTDSLPRINGAKALYPLYAAFVQATFPHPDESEFPMLRNHPLLGYEYLSYPDAYSADSLFDNTEEYYDIESFYDPYWGFMRGGSTPQAYTQLFYGEADVIFCSKPSKEQLERAAATGKELHLTPIGREAFVFFVNAENPVNGLTQEQIRGIYSGDITNWRKVGGKKKSIRPFQRPEGSGSQTMLEHIMGDCELIEAPNENMVGGMGGIINQTARYRNHGNAIGYSFLFFTTGMVRNNQIKLLEIDGVMPDKSTIADGTYPFTGDFYAITLGEPKANVRKLIDWILSPQGQQLVERTGYVGL